LPINGITSADHPEGRVLLLGTLRSRSRRFAPALVGMVALVGGFLLLQYGQTSSDASAAVVQAAHRGDSQTASRGASRSSETAGAISLQAQSASSDGILEGLDLNQLTTTTLPPTTTTTLPPTTTTTAPPSTTTAKPAPAPKPPVETKPSGPITDDVWTRLAKCESGMRNDQGAPYYGYFQFTAQTWKGLGGSGLPTDHTYEEQLEMAKKLQARSGWGQWPVCSKKALAG
jgi:hypothetical protein